MTRTARYSFNQKQSAVMKNVASSWKDFKQQSQPQSFKATDKIKNKKNASSQKKQLIARTHITKIAADWADLSIVADNGGTSTSTNSNNEHKTVDFSIGKNNNNTPENNPKNNDDNNRNYNSKQNFTNNKKSKRKLSTKEINNETTNNGRHSRCDQQQQQQQHHRIEADGKRTNQFEKRTNAAKSLKRLNGSTKRQLNRPCFQCRRLGHVLANCPDLKSGTGLCFKCGSTEHGYRECKVIKGNNFKNAVCFICSKTGHISKQCPKNTNGVYPSGGSCNLCGKNDHLCRDCPGLGDRDDKPIVAYAGLRNENVEMLD